MGSISGRRTRQPPPLARLAGRLHRLVIGSIAIVVVTVISSWGTTGGGIDGITVRLWLLLAVVVAAVLAVASGFDRRYPTPSIGAVLLRAVAVGALVALALLVVADPFVHGPADGQSPRVTALLGVVLIVGLLTALWYGRRPVEPTLGETSGWRHRRSFPTGPVAVGIVAVPTLLGHLLLAFFTAYCGGGGAGLLWLLAGLATPLTLWVVERALDDRWPLAGLAVAIGRLVLVVVLQAVVLLVATEAIAGDASCESTIGVDADEGAARISRIATGQ